MFGTSVEKVVKRDSKWAVVVQHTSMFTQFLCLASGGMTGMYSGMQELVKVPLRSNFRYPFFLHFRKQ